VLYGKGQAAMNDDIGSKTDPDEHGETLDAGYCPIPTPPDLSGLTVVALSAERPVADYREAMAIADREASGRLSEYMLLSWYDRDRDFESPQHTSECHEASAVPGYVDYGLNHGATLKVDVDTGRFVFFYGPVDL
jgi:uncharacterized protein DUF5619